MARVSVIIPAYNRSDVLKECLQSVARQTYQDFEIIVVDDGSSDDTKNVVSRFKGESKSSVKYIYQDNQGPAAARNLGIQSASGELVAFLDSDDLWEPKKLAKQLKQMDQCEDCALSFTDMSHDENGKIMYESYFEHFHHDFNEQNLFEKIFHSNFIYLPTVMIRRACFQEVGLFNEELQVKEDFELWIRCLLRYKVCWLAEALTIRRFNDNNLSNDKYPFYRDGISLLSNLIHNYELTPKQLHVISKALGYNYFSLAYYYFENYEMAKSRANFAGSIKFHCRRFSSVVYFLCSYLPVNIIRRLRGFKRHREKAA